MSDEPARKLPDNVPDTEPTILTLIERLTNMQEAMDRRHLETQEMITSLRGEVGGVRGDVNSVRDDVNSVRDDVNSVRDDVNQKYELLVSRIDLLRSETEAHFRKQDHLILALNDIVLHARGDQRELFERIAVLEERTS
jgi:predicted  nucleic acid-binding Zn-ribbon protein